MVIREKSIVLRHEELQTTAWILISRIQTLSINYKPVSNIKQQVVMYAAITTKEGQKTINKERQLKRAERILESLGTHVDMIPRHITPSEFARKGKLL